MVVGEQPFVCLIYLASLVLVWQPSSPPGGAEFRTHRSCSVQLSKSCVTTTCAMGGVAQVTRTFVLGLPKGHKSKNFVTRKTLPIFVYVSNSWQGGSSEATSYTPRSAWESSVPPTGAGRIL